MVQIPLLEEALGIQRHLWGRLRVMLGGRLGGRLGGKGRVGHRRFAAPVCMA